MQKNMSRNAPHVTVLSICYLDISNRKNETLNLRDEQIRFWDQSARSH